MREIMETMNKAIVEGRDFFTDRSVLLKPYDYLDSLREQSPAGFLTNRDMVMVTGFAEAVEVLLNTRDFSSVITTGGPTAPLPFAPQGDDITNQIAEHHAEFVGRSSSSRMTGRAMPRRVRCSTACSRPRASRPTRPTCAVWPIRWSRTPSRKANAN
jgi:hypothetical protein